MVMGNVSGKKDETGPSGTKDEEGEEYMEYAHDGAHVSYHAHDPYPESMVQSPPHTPRASQSPLMFTPQVPLVPLQRSDGVMEIPSNELTAKYNRV
ncbi:hypothetical protein F0562_008177 [Nyssa sinensis]|uniref:Uncharacterized protein n=1 Tax=Nyssa sinensis TaxID=561372 RepID=A0A5J5A7Y9_9ASTE|nr:hypothetical protein F0562_008177 [Nyssa sinensis]